MIFQDQLEKICMEFSIYIYPRKNPKDDVVHITGDASEIGGWFKTRSDTQEFWPQVAAEKFDPFTLAHVRFHWKRTCAGVSGSTASGSMSIKRPWATATFWSTRPKDRRYGNAIQTDTLTWRHVRNLLTTLEIPSDDYPSGVLRWCLTQCHHHTCTSGLFSTHVQT